MNKEEPKPQELDEDGNPVEPEDADFKYWADDYIVEGYLSMIWI